MVDHARDLLIAEGASVGGHHPIQPPHGAPFVHDRQPVRRRLGGRERAVAKVRHLDVEAEHGARLSGAVGAVAGGAGDIPDLGAAAWRRLRRPRPRRRPRDREGDEDKAGSPRHGLNGGSRRARRQPSASG